MIDRLADYDTEDSIAALATPWGESALAVIRTSGKDSLTLLAKVFSKSEKLLAAPGGSLVHGHIRDGERPLDEVVLGVYRAPKSYTGEDGAEIYCHGSVPGLKALLALLERTGFRRAGPGEFTFRAFFHGKLDLTRAEAVQEIVSAKTGKAQELALHRLGGAVERRINGYKGRLLELLAAVEIRLDYPEEDVEEAPLPADAVKDVIAGIGELLTTYREGRIYREGLRVAIAGRTNAGKSSLFNLFLREDRSIVSDLHGTTRDYIEAFVSVEGIPVHLYDTAGLRETEDPVEGEGVKRSRAIIANSGIVLYLVDAAEGLGPEDASAIEELGGRGLVVFTKIDKAPKPAGKGLGLSTLTCEGFPELLKELGKRALTGIPAASGELVLDSERQKTHLEHCLASLEEFLRGLEAKLPLDVLAVDLQAALRSLGEITGEVTTEDVLKTMFASFCVGK